VHQVGDQSRLYPPSVAHRPSCSDRTQGPLVLRETWGSQSHVAENSDPLNSEYGGTTMLRNIRSYLQSTQMNLPEYLNAGLCFIFAL